MGKFQRVTDIIYNLVRKRLTLKGDGTGITSLPDSARVERGMENVFKRLKEGGYNPVTADKAIQSEDDLARVLENINQMEQAKLRAAEQQTKMNNVVQEVMDKMATGKTLNPLDRQKLESSGFKVDASRDMFKGFQPKVIPGGKREIIQPKNASKDIIDANENLAGGANYAKGDTKYNADVLADEVARFRGLDPDELPTKDKIKLYGEAYDYLTEVDRLNKPKKPRNKKSKGGVINAIKNLLKKSKPKKSGDKIYGVGGEEIDVADLKKSLGLDEATDKKSMEDLEKKLQMIIGKERTKHAGGGLMSAVKKLQKKFGKNIIQKGKAPKRNEKKKLQDLFREFNRKNKAGGGVAHMLGEPRENFADGGMSRRTFLKIMAALASFPVVGKLAKTMKVAKGAAPIITPTSEMPAHFPKLVEKIIREGQVVKKDFIKKTGDVTTYKHPDRPDIELTIEGDGNRIQLDFDTDQGMKGGYEFRKGVADEVNPRPPNDFEAGEVKYKFSQDGESYSKDFELGIDTGTENLDEFAGVGKQKTSKSKVNLPESLDDDFADGGLAGLLGE